VILNNPAASVYGPHYCMNCGKPVNEGVGFCEQCGVTLGHGAGYCANCGAPSTPDSRCNACGYVPSQWGNKPLPVGYVQKSRLAAGLLGIFLGAFGIGRYYLGYKKMAGFQLAATIFTMGFAGGIWGLIDGIMILTGFVKSDGNGYPLA
jgi:TM2 domain-containing membrane protein YozV